MKIIQLGLLVNKRERERKINKIRKGVYGNP